MNNRIHLRKIKNIIFFTSFDEFHSEQELQHMNQLRFSIVYKFHHTMTNLDLFCTSDNNISRQNLSRLYEFRNLTDLTIECSGDSDITLFDVLENGGQNLKSLEFYCQNASVPNNVYQSLSNIRLRSATSDGTGGEWNYNVASSNLSSSANNPIPRQFNYLENMDLSLPSLPLLYIVYLSNCLPSTMKCIRLMMFDTELLAWIEEHGINIISTLVRRLSIMKKVLLLTRKEDSDPGQEEAIIESERMSMLYQLLDLLKQKQGGQHQENEEVRYCSANYTFEYNYYTVNASLQTAESTAIYLEDESLFFGCTQLLSRPLLQSSPILSAKGTQDEVKVIDSLTFKLKGCTSSSSSSRIEEEISKYALVNYPYLDSLVVQFYSVDSISNSYFHAHYGEEEHNLSTIRLLPSSSSSRGEKEGNSDITNNNIVAARDTYNFTHITLVGIKLSPEGITKFLAVSFPYIKHIQQSISEFTVGEERFLRSTIEIKGDINCMASDFTPFENLETLEISKINTQLNNTAEHVFVRLGFSSGDNVKEEIECYEIIKSEEATRSTLDNKKKKYNLKMTPLDDALKHMKNGKILFIQVACNRIKEVTFYDLEDDCIAKLCHGVLQQ